MYSDLDSTFEIKEIQEAFSLLFEECHEIRHK
jgi:hypothetical protein